MKDADEATDPLHGITVLTEPTAELLNERQQIDFRTTRENCLKWLLGFGKNPQKAEGYARSTLKTRSHRIDQFYRWTWENQTGGYTTNVTHEHADAWMEHLAMSDYSTTHKSNCRKALLMLYRWRQHERESVPLVVPDEYAARFETLRDYLETEMAILRDVTLTQELALLVTLTQENPATKREVTE